MKSSEIIEVIKAYERGEKIECKNRSEHLNDDWGLANSPTWNFAQYDYRVKPKIKEFWMLFFFDGTNSFPFESEKGAKERAAAHCDVKEIAHFRQVLP